MFKAFKQQPAAVNDVLTGAPVVPVQQDIPWANRLRVPAGNQSVDAPYVSRTYREKLRILYAYGVQQRNWFRMISTGAVESSKYMPVQGVKFYATFNDALYEAGYPQNTGISFKVETTPDSLKQGNGPRMQPQPQQTNSIFTRRAFNTAPSLNAKPSAS
jgi:hypothetical protein